MSTAVSGAIVGIALIAVLALVGGYLVSSVDTLVAENFNEKIMKENMYSGIQLEVYRVYVDQFDIPEAVEIINTGSRPIWDFASSDLIIVFKNSRTGITLSLPLDYGAEWMPTLIGRIDADRGITYVTYIGGEPVYPGETIVLDINLSQSTKNTIVSLEMDEVTIIFTYSTGSRALFSYLR
ncbi:hypothetical protein ACAM_1196 [Aeropyrum camini SY1 = JCM 12091]|uniref:Uncharacterized protein n=1 Tax=Aeropyrum camini SY1 = JCM 12091 TaxID=1198449 RepID=U3TF67_9CREN|nr:hypothetical protein ACAM_1196 [Aeropyrum camini SY1 = JCM 12091]